MPPEVGTHDYRISVSGRATRPRTTDPPVPVNAGQRHSEAAARKGSVTGRRSAGGDEGWSTKRDLIREMKTFSVEPERSRVAAFMARSWRWNVRIDAT